MLNPFDDFRERMLLSTNSNYHAKKQFLLNYGILKEMPTFNTLPGINQFLLLLGTDAAIGSAYLHQTPSPSLYPEWLAAKLRDIIPWAPFQEAQLERLLSLLFLSTHGLPSDLTRAAQLKMGMASLILLRILTGYSNRGIKMYLGSYSRDTQTPGLVTYGKRKVFISQNWQAGIHHLLPILEAGLPWIADDEVFELTYKVQKKLKLKTNDMVAQYYTFLNPKDESCTQQQTPEEVEETELITA